MQYILSEEEYGALKAVQEEHIKLERKKLAELCTKIADTMPITVSWDKKSPPEPWRCRVTVEDEGQEHYCDGCPVRSICPLGKRWSQ